MIFSINISNWIIGWPYILYHILSHLFAVNILSQIFCYQLGQTFVQIVAMAKLNEKITLKYLHSI